MRAILVDDEPIMLKSFMRNSAGISELDVIEQFQNAEEAIAYAEKNSFDLALLDVCLPKMNGIDLALKLRELHPELLVVFITACDEYIRESNRIGGDYYIVKPYKKETIEMMVKKMALLCKNKEPDEISPFGVIEFTLDAKHRITYMNDEMLRLLGGNCEPQSEWLDMLRNDVSFMVSFSEKNQFLECVARVQATGQPESFDFYAIKYDGNVVRLTSWIYMSSPDSIKGNFIDSTQKQYIDSRERIKGYVSAVKAIYSNIIKLDIKNNTLCNLQGETLISNSTAQSVQHVLTDALSYFIKELVIQEDRTKLRMCLEKVMRPETRSTQESMLHVDFRVQNPGDIMRWYSGVFIDTEEKTVLFCFNETTDKKRVISLEEESRVLKKRQENMYEIMRHLSETMIAFFTDGNIAKPMFISDNIVHFFRMTREEYLDIMQNGMPVKEFLAKMNLSCDDYLSIIDGNELVIEYTDLATDTRRKMCAFCLPSIADGDDEVKYVAIKRIFDEEEEQNSVESAGKDIYIRTFGYFDVFVDGQAVAFRHEKSKELLALLVDRKGGFVSAGDAISCLWEDELVTKVTQARYRKVAMRLKNILDDLGIGDIIEVSEGQRRLVLSKVRCDLYDYLSSKPEHVNLFKGAYLSNYSWGEMTLAELLN